MPEGTLSAMDTDEPGDANLAIVRQIDIEAAARGWSRAELLRRADISASTYARYASGQRKMGVDVLLDVASALDLKVSVLAARAEERYGESFSPPRTKIAEGDSVKRARGRKASDPPKPRSAPRANGSRRGP